jgi:hypothetical protein
VASPKTEHHEGKDSRDRPIFPERAKPLHEVFDQAEDRAEYVIVRYCRANCNLRTQRKRILKRAGLEPWPRLLQNLRSTRETELAGEYPLHVVTYWIGNTAWIAAKHYLQIPDEIYEKAAQNAAHAAQQALAVVCTESHKDPQESPINADFAVIGAEIGFAQNEPVEAGGFEPQKGP